MFAEATSPAEPGMRSGDCATQLYSDKRKESAAMKKYVCGPCGYEYDPEVGDPDNGIAPGTAFEDLPEDWVCPLCSVDKDNFSEG